MKEKILVLVRATPQESRRHGHTVCVAEINEKDEWRRLYPFEFAYGKGLIDFKRTKSPLGGEPPQDTPKRYIVY